MKTKINRRTFIKLIGLTTLSALALPSCKKPTKKVMTAAELYDYSIIRYYEDNEPKLKYVIPVAYSVVYDLKIEDDSIEEEILYDMAEDDEKDIEKSIKENIINALNIDFYEPALNSLEENFGPKYEYTTEELNSNLEIVKRNLNKDKTKVLTK